MENTPYLYDTLVRVLSQHAHWLDFRHQKRREAPAFMPGMDRRWARRAQCPRAQQDLRSTRALNGRGHCIGGSPGIHAGEDVPALILNGLVDQDNDIRRLTVLVLGELRDVYPHDGKCGMGSDVRRGIQSADLRI